MTAPFKALIVIPSFEQVKLNLKDIDWVIVGGPSDPMAGPFNVEWALDLWQQCRAQAVPFFLKQLGRKPIFDGTILSLLDAHGGDWDEWPEEWRVREMPHVFRKMMARDETATLPLISL